MAPGSAPALSASPWAWAALAAALSPAGVELARHLSGEPPDRYVLVAAVLIGLSLRSGAEIPRSTPLPALGIGMLLAAVLVELLGIAIGSWWFARLAIPVAVCGLALGGGTLSPRVALLAFGLIPVPNFIVTLGTPEVESALARWLAGAVGGLVAIEPAGPLLHGAGGRLELQPHDDPLRLALVLAMLGWYAALRRGEPWPRGLARALAFAGGSLVLQPLALLLAVGLLAAGAPDAAALWLRSGAWLAVAAIGLLLIHRTGQPEPRERSAATARS